MIGAVPERDPGTGGSDFRGVACDQGIRASGSEILQKEQPEVSGFGILRASHEPALAGSSSCGKEIQVADGT